MSETKESSNILKLKEQLADGKIERREFLRYSTLLGLSAGAAYAFAGKVGGLPFASPAQAAIPKGGTIRISMRVLDVKDPHTFSWVQDSNVTRQVCEYLTKTGTDNVTRPYLAESWTVSDDLLTWDFKMRQGVKWHSGREFTAEDAVWNLKRMLDPATGSSVVGLMQGYLMKEEDGKSVLWDANAIELVDSHTLRLNLKEAQVAVPEHLFHYPALILDPEGGGTFGVGSNGTGPFELVEHEIGVKSVLKARSDYWGDGPYLDTVEFIDLGDDPSAAINALASKQVDGIFEGDVSQIDAFKAIPHLEVYQAVTAQTGVARMHSDVKPFDDPKVRKAMRLAIDTPRCLELGHRGLGAPGEHHHVSPVHPDYAKLEFMKRDVEAAKKLLADAGYPDGIDVEIAVKKDPAWELIAVQAMVEQWKDANIRVAINVMPSAQYWDIWTKVPFGFTNWTHRPLGFMVLGLAYRTGVPWNESNYSNPEFDALLTQAEGVLDVEKRRDLMAQLETIMQEDGPIVQPLWRSVFVAYDKKVKGFKMHPTLYLFMNEIGMEA
ncbi:ABC transporter substrate-binding protein [Oceanibacterium hippocampi]|uniref:Heme-binding protein A n=1 Tax=Oceanibacterium hippocampi TaxID=745714 RepID=A0A1Y5SQ46_9PROT|nr:ABC transporter substrate-binding protein [Oceanibacterium hippocampi]SLN45571.1 Heme-binding protein A precursor [Oceanibacterium hippocampi]